MMMHYFFPIFGIFFHFRNIACYIIEEYRPLHSTPSFCKNDRKNLGNIIWSININPERNPSPSPGRNLWTIFGGNAWRIPWKNPGGMPLQISEGIQGTIPEKISRGLSERIKTDFLKEPWQESQEILLLKKKVRENLMKKYQKDSWRNHWNDLRRIPRKNEEMSKKYH